MTDETEEHPDIGGFPQGDAPIAALADRQHGVVASRQLVALGYGRRAIEHRIAAGRLHPIHRAVYAVGRRLLSREGHWMAAVLACGPGALISHRTAAALWDLRPTAQTKIDVTFSGSGRASRDNLRVHSTARLHAEDIATVDRIPVTSISRTLLDLAAVLDADRLTRVIEQAVRLRLFDLRALDRAMTRTPRRRGVRLLRAVLADYREPAPTRSELERRFLQLVREGALPTPRVNTQVAGLEVDFFWPEWRLVVELDGRGYHVSPRAFERDRVRDAILQRAGCRVLRVTHKRLGEPAKVLDDVRALGRMA